MNLKWLRASRAKLRDARARIQKRIDRRNRQIKAARKRRARRKHKHHDWMPGARIHKAASAGTAWQVSCPPRGVLHTTESDGDATATLDTKRAWPHFQVEQNGRITQYYPLSIGSRALVHNGPPTNGAHAFQIEVCAHAANPNWPTAQREAVRRVMRFIEANGGVARECNVDFRNPKRLSSAAWLALRGWCGHVHVPGNDHWDPGKLDIKELL